MHQLAICGKHIKLCAIQSHCDDLTYILLDNKLLKCGDEILYIVLVLSVTFYLQATYTFLIQESLTFCTRVICELLMSRLYFARELLMYNTWALVTLA